MIETWKDIKEYEGLYQVSDLGRVKSLPKPYKNNAISKEKILKQRVNDNGYCVVDLYKDGKRKVYRVHKLVMQEFLCENHKLDINHIDCNKTNNKLSNLEYCTRQENMIHAVKNGLSRGCIKVKKEVVKNGIKV